VAVIAVLALTALPAAAAPRTVTIRAALNPTIVNWVFYFSPNYTSVLTLDFKGVPSSTKVVLSCTGRSCPFAKRTVRPPHGTTVHVGSWLRHAHLRAGTRLTVSIMQAGSIGKRYTFTIRADKPPASRVVALRPGTT
jgi:hypothetical protein